MIKLNSGLSKWKGVYKGYYGPLDNCFSSPPSRPLVERFFSLPSFDLSVTLPRLFFSLGALE